MPAAAPAARRVAESRVDMFDMVLPQDTNTLGNILGGYVMHRMDQAGAMAAVRHCRRPCVTASVDRLDFLNPIKLGHFMLLKASVNAAFGTSMEVGVRVESEHPLTGERHHTSSAYFTFVALDDTGKPAKVPPLLTETPEDRRREKQAHARRAQRLRDKQAHAAERGH